MSKKSKRRAGPNLQDIAEVMDIQTDDECSEESSMSQDAETLEDQLREKEEVVAALTGRMEDMAEQLDRLRRNGSARGMKLAGGIPSELIDEQRTLVADLQQAVQQWEDMQAAAAFGRIEIQISELRDLITGMGAGNADHWRSAPPVSHMSESAYSQPEVREPDPAPVGSNHWEAVKNSLLASAGIVQEEPIPLPDREMAVTLTDLHAAAILEDMPDAPEAVDVATASIEQLRQSVLDRDTYVTSLLRRMRIVELHAQDRTGWKTIENVPEELRARLEKSETQLEQMLRLAEVEHSLERARLAREESRIKLLEESATRMMKKAELLRNRQSAVPESEENLDDDESAKRGSWLRMFGLGREANDEGEVQ